MSELQSLRHLVCRLLLVPSTTAMYTLSLHDALPIFLGGEAGEIDGVVVHDDAAHAWAVLEAFDGHGLVPLHRQDCIADAMALRRIGATARLITKQEQIGRAHV